MSISDHTRLVPYCLCEGLPHGDTNVFNRVVRINVQVSLGLHLQINQAVPCDLIEHVFEKRNACFKGTISKAVEIQSDSNLGFGRVADNIGVTHRRNDTFGRMKPFWKPFLSTLTPYVPGEQPKVEGLIKLNTNENPYPPSAKALEAMRQAVNDSLRLYPDPAATELKLNLSHRFGISPEQVFVGNGSDEVLAFLFQALMGQAGGCAFPAISYSFYPVYCKLYAIESKPFELADDFSIDLSKVPQGAGSLILPNPNAPTGIALGTDAIAAHAHDHPHRLLVIDEAYVDFGADSCVPLISQHENLMVVQTLSKSRALAGLRLGFAFGPAELIEALERVKNSFNSYTVDRIAIAGAVAAIGDEAWFEANRLRVIENRDRLRQDLGNLGFEVLDSKANFVFARHPAHDAAELAQALRQRKILVRHFDKAGISQFLRVTVGDESQCESLVLALRSLIAADAA